MVLDNKTVISALKKMVGSNKQTAAGAKKPALDVNTINGLNQDLEKMVLADSKQDGSAQRCVKIAIDEGSEDIIEQGTELLPRTESTRQKRKRAVSECASIIVDPTQVKVDQILKNILKYKQFF